MSLVDTHREKDLTFSSLKKDITCKTWYALWTMARTEKKLHTRLEDNGIESFLPLQRVLRQWKDRKKVLEMPLFSSYLFVKITQQEYLKVLNLPGAVRFISFEGKAVPIPEKQIEAIRLFLKHDIQLESTTNFIPKGTMVRVKSGPLIGLEAELSKYVNNTVVLIRLDVIGQNILVRIPVHELEIVG